ncbi:UvrD-helicase domain-containing protein [Candidatus Peregrinibacteria bacterium]|nr:UvrD-helicase domain-containing protein [Candidatus Peregrinibacteria bacterium]
MSGTTSIIADLNDKQREAVLATDGPVLVIAGAGSGKTQALTHRIACLIKEKGVNPRSILAVTFTNKAAGEMRNRVTKLLGLPEKSPNLPVIGTFHSFCVKILRKHIHLLDYENQFTIYDTGDQQVLMKYVFADLKVDPKEINPRAVLSHISNAKNRLVGPKEFESMATGYFEEKVARFYHLYQNKLKKNNALDFDDLLMKTVELLQNHKEVLEHYQERFRYIHVDEYQDTNRSQYMLTNMLAAKYRNLYVVGDHDQAIYSWRGADIGNILDFEKDYPDAKVIKMEQNYRSTQIILDAAQAVISRNTLRKKKELWTERSGGETVKLWVAENERHEGELCAAAIKEAMKKHEFPDYRDFVILYRTNAQSRVLEEVFMRYGIPYKIIGGIRFYERKEIKDILAYLKVIANPADTVSLMRIVNTPQRQIGPKTLEKLQTFANIKDCSFFEAMSRADEIDEELPAAKKENVKKFAGLIKKFQKQNLDVTASALIKFVFDESGYKKFIDDGSVEGEARTENVLELISVAAKYDKLAPGLSLNIFLEEVALIADIDHLDEKDNAVTFMTLHAAKGLEFPWVFICGLEEGLLPHSQSLLAPEQLEEERRLFYVGCTRAMDRLHLLHTKNRMLYGETQDAVPSQFLGDIPKELVETNEKDAPRQAGRSNVIASPWLGLFGKKRARAAGDKLKMGNRPVPTERVIQDFADGDKVMHELFGEGIVISVTGGIVTVAFKDPTIGVKKLAVAIAPMQKI